MRKLAHANHVWGIANYVRIQYLAKHAKITIFGMRSIKYAQKNVLMNSIMI